MLSKHPILSLGTFSRPLRCHGKSDKVYVTKNGEKKQCEQKRTHATTDTVSLKTVVYRYLACDQVMPTPVDTNYVHCA